MAIEVVEDAVGEVIDAHFLNLGQGDINLAVRTHLLDEGGQPVADVDVLVNLVLVNLAPMGVIDNHAVAQVAALCHQHLYFFAVVIVGVCLVEEFGEFGTGDDAVAGLIQIDTYDVAAAHFHVNPLLAEGYQQVFGDQTPIEEGAHLVNRLDTHECKVTDDGIGLLGGGDGAVLAVVIDKHADGVTHLHFGGEVAFGQQHFVGVIVDKIGSEIDRTVDAQLVVFSNFHISKCYKMGPRHGVTEQFFAKFGKKIHFTS